MFKKEKRFLEFVELVSRLEPSEYFGLCKILGVQMYDEKAAPREFADTLEDVLDSFLKMKKGPRRQLMTLLRGAIKGSEEENNGSISEN